MQHIAHIPNTDLVMDSGALLTGAELLERARTIARAKSSQPLAPRRRKRPENVEIVVSSNKYVPPRIRVVEKFVAPPEAPPLTGPALPEPTYATLRQCMDIASALTGIPKNEILSRRRNKGTCFARQLFFYLARRDTVRSFPEIGRYTGGRDHTTVLHSVKVYPERAMKRGFKTPEPGWHLRLEGNGG